MAVNPYATAIRTPHGKFLRAMGWFSEVENSSRTKKTANTKTRKIQNSGRKDVITAKKFNENENGLERKYFYDDQKPKEKKKFEFSTWDKVKMFFGFLPSSR